MPGSETSTEFDVAPTIIYLLSDSENILCVRKRLVRDKVVIDGFCDTSEAPVGSSSEFPALLHFELQDALLQHLVIVDHLQFL